MTNLWRFVCEAADVRKIEKLETLTNIGTFYDDVRRFTKNVHSDHSIGRWQALANLRFEELLEEAKADSEEDQESPEIVEITDEIKTRKYAYGDYIIETEETKEDGKGIVNFYIRRKDSGFVMFVYGLPYDQPDLVTGPTVYTYEDVFEMFCSNIESDIQDYEEELAEMEGRC